MLLYYCQILGQNFVFLFRIYLCDKIFTYLTDTDAYSKLNETSKMEHFGTIVSTLKLLTIWETFHIRYLSGFASQISDMLLLLAF